MIECHPLLRPFVQLAKPVVHAVKTWHPRVIGVRHHVHHHVHRLLAAATPPQAVMTVCQRVAGPLIAGGLILLPPASAVWPAGGVGGFPGAIVPEYGAPAFFPGFASQGPLAYGSGGGYGPAALGLGGIAAPAGIGASSQVPVLFTNSLPDSSTAPITGMPTLPSEKVPGTSTPQLPQPPDTLKSTPPSTSSPKPPATPGSQPGNDTLPVVNTPEPASIVLLGGVLAAIVLSRALWSRRARRN